MRFININVAEFDAYKHAALPLVGDARVTLEELEAALAGYRVDAAYSRAPSATWKARWDGEVRPHLHAAPRPAHQPGRSDRRGQPHQRGRRTWWCARRAACPATCTSCGARASPSGYHLEYGYSCMGYEIAGGLGVKMADPAREVYVMVGDGSYLMMSSEIVTSVQEGFKLTIVVLDNHGFASIGGLVAAPSARGGFGTDYRLRGAESGQLDGDSCRSISWRCAAGLGARAVRATTREEVEQALADMRGHDRTSVVVVEVDKESACPATSPGGTCPISEVSEIESIRQARARYEEAVKKERRHEVAAGER